MAIPKGRSASFSSQLNLLSCHVPLSFNLTYCFHPVSFPLDPPHQEARGQRTNLPAISSPFPTLITLIHQAPCPDPWIHMIHIPTPSNGGAYHGDVDDVTKRVTRDPCAANRIERLRRPRYGAFRKACTAHAGAGILL